MSRLNFSYQARLLVLLVFFCAFEGKAQTWQNVGQNAQPLTTASQIGCPSLLVSKSGDMYSLYRNQSYLTSQKCSTMGGYWSPSASFSTGLNGILRESNNIPYACVRVYESGAYHAKVYKLIGSNWEQIGAAIPAYDINSFEMSPQGVPYVAITKSGYADELWKFENGSWQLVVNPPNYSGNLTISFDNTGVLYGVYSTTQNTLSVMKFVSNQWVSVGILPSTDVSGQYVFNIAVDHNNVVYVAFTQSNSNRNRVRIMRCINNNWTDMLNASSLYLTNFHGRLSRNNKGIAIDANGVPYFIFEEWCCADEVPQTLPSRLYVKKYVGTSWQNVGDAIGTTSYYGEIAINSYGNPVISYIKNGGFYIKTFPACPAASIATTLPANSNTSLNVAFAQSGLSTTPSIVWTAQNLPAGLNMSSTGVLSGFPTTPGTYTFTALASQGSCYASKTYTVSFCPAVSIMPSTLPNPQNGVPYSSQTLTQTGFTGSIIWSISSGALPSGLSLNPNTGTISGTANQGGNFSFVVQVKKDGCAATKSYTLSVECPIISIEPSNLQDGLLGATYTQQLTQTGLVGAVTWQVSTGGLPNGLSLATNTGVISGTPTTLGTFNFVIRAASASMGCNTTKTYTINVPSACASITPSVIPSAHYCTPYSIKFGASGTDVVWSISTNIPGLTFANGILSGYPTGNNGQTGNYSFTVTRAQGDCTVSRSYTLKVICPAPGFISDPINGAGTRDVQQKK